MNIARTKISEKKDGSEEHTEYKQALKKLQIAESAVKAYKMTGSSRRQLDELESLATFIGTDGINLPPLMRELKRDRDVECNFGSPAFKLEIYLQDLDFQPAWDLVHLGITACMNSTLLVQTCDVSTRLCRACAGILACDERERIDKMVLLQVGRLK
jgi:hypothetical protein